MPGTGMHHHVVTCISLGTGGMGPGTRRLGLVTGGTRFGPGGVGLGGCKGRGWGHEGQGLETGRRGLGTQGLREAGSHRALQDHCHPLLLLHEVEVLAQVPSPTPRPQELGVLLGGAAEPGSGQLGQGLGAHGRAHPGDVGTRRRHPRSTDWGKSSENTAQLGSADKAGGAPALQGRRDSLGTLGAGPQGESPAGSTAQAGLHRSGAGTAESGHSSVQGWALPQAPSPELGSPAPGGSAPRSRPRPWPPHPERAPEGPSPLLQVTVTELCVRMLLSRDPQPRAPPKRWAGLLPQIPGVTSSPPLAQGRRDPQILVLGAHLAHRAAGALAGIKPG